MPGNDCIIAGPGTPCYVCSDCSAVSCRCRQTPPRCAQLLGLGVLRQRRANRPKTLKVTWYDTDGETC